ncbi:ribonuclease HI [Desulfoscipio gibsoniae]|uniref:Ribonuclease H n=1 Tax=Desulfoscipio gibsoniae DSM 7213 TaxID=767817 RepID=R4KG33_9FIRM|nr:ribonuclease HI [Desulfoscipio gibsoniae]AGL01539.1 ribonuclease HI [Desulfoscipio gibsoniae DSM 7213]
MKEVEIYTDGACSGNPGPGGYGTVLKYGIYEKELYGAYDNTTNNRMELMAVIKGLESLKEPCLVTVYSDSKYVVDAITKGWVTRWRAKGWMRNSKERAKNIDLWQRLLQLAEGHQIRWVWVKGHADNEYNNRCDRLAVDAIKNCPRQPDNPL